MEGIVGLYLIYFFGVLSLPWIFRAFALLLNWCGEGAQFVVRLAVREVSRKRKIRELERRAEEVFAVWEKMIRDEPLTAAECDAFNKRPCLDEDWAWLGEPWRRYKTTTRALFERHEAARAERRRREQEARKQAEQAERAARDAREKAKKDARENAGRERQEREEPQEQPLDPYLAALRLLKLREGRFTRATFNRHYREAMIAAHPDKGGTTEQAQAVNGARDLIRRRHGWV